LGEVFGSSPQDDGNASLTDRIGPHRCEVCGLCELGAPAESSSFHNRVEERVENVPDVWSFIEGDVALALGCATKADMLFNPLVNRSVGRWFELIPPGSFESCEGLFLLLGSEEASQKPSLAQFTFFFCGVGGAIGLFSERRAS
jgi:hypothetical protein